MGLHTGKLKIRPDAVVLGGNANERPTLVVKGAPYQLREEATLVDCKRRLA